MEQEKEETPIETNALLDQNVKEDIEKQMSMKIMDTISAVSSCECIRPDGGQGYIRPENHPEVFIPPIPDGGYGWVVLFASFMNNFIIDGIAYAYGVLMMELLEAFDTTKSQVSLIGSLLCGVYLGSGPIASALINKYGCRTITIAGALISGLAFFISSYATSVTFLFLSYGTIGGFGFGLIYLPSVIIVNQYFEKKRLIAVGIAVCGSGFGAFAFAPFMSVLLKVYDWSNAMLILSGLLFNCAVFGALMRPLMAPISMLDTDDSENVKAKFINQLNEHKCGDADNSMPGGKGGDDVEQPSYNKQLSSVIMDEVEKYARKADRVYGKPNAALSPPDVADPNNILKSLTNFPTEFQRHCDLRSSNWVSSVPNLNSSARHVVHRMPQGPAPIIILPPSVSKEDYSRPLYRKDIFFSGSVLNVASQNIIKRLDSAKAAALEQELSPGSQLFDSFIMSMTQIPIDDSMMYPPATTDSSRWTRWTRLCRRGRKTIIPKVVWDVLAEMTDFSLLRNPGFLIYWIASLIMLGYWTPNFYLPDFAASCNISRDKGALLLSLMGITNLVARPLFNLVSSLKPLTPLLVSNVTLFLAGFVTLFVPYMVTFPALAAYSGAYGLLVAPPIALTSPLLCNMVGLDKLTNAFGLISLARGISSLLGPPLSGILADLTGNKDLPFVFGGVSTVICGILCFLIHLPRFQPKDVDKTEATGFGSQALFQSATQLCSVPPIIRSDSISKSEEK